MNTDFNAVPSSAFFDGQLAYKLPFGPKRLETEVYLNVANLLDKGLVYASRTGGATPLPTDPGLFD